MKAPSSRDGSTAMGEASGTPVSRRGFLRQIVGGGLVLGAVPVLAQGRPAPVKGERFGLGADTRLPAVSQETALFNGKDLTGWDSYLVEEGVAKEDVWSVENGVLVCRGEPGGYLYTTEEFEDFKLVVEWRWPEEPGNSGVLLRVTPEPVMLPPAVEAQLRSGSAGDMYGFQGFTIGGDPDRLSEISIGWSLGKIKGNEKEPGEWNRYEITADGPNITLVVNGKTVNEATGCEVRPGRIGLQSEGGVIEFRTVALTLLP